MAALILRSREAVANFERLEVNFMRVHLGGILPLRPSSSLAGRVLRSPNSAIYVQG